VFTASSGVYSEKIPFIVERGVLRFSDGGYDLQWREWATAAPAPPGGPRIVKNYFVGSLGRDSDVQIEESMMDPCYDVWE